VDIFFFFQFSSKCRQQPKISTTKKNTRKEGKQFTQTETNVAFFPHTKTKNGQQEKKIGKSEGKQKYKGN